MIRIFLCGLQLASCVVAIGQTRPTQGGAVPAKIERFLELCETSRRGAILQLEHQLRGLRNQKSPTLGAGRQIARLEAQLQSLNANTQPVVPQLAFPPQQEAIGRLPRLSCHVEQVISDDEVLVRCRFPVVVAKVRNFQAQRDKVDQDVQLLIRGLKTTDFREGSDMEMLQVFEVIGRETYQLVGGGSSEVLVLKEFDMKSLDPYFRAGARRQ
jgi:hypothetical protein